MAGQINAEGTTLGTRIRKYVQVRVLLLLRQDGGKKTRGICFFTLCYLPCHPFGANANKITLVILGSSPKLLLFLSPQLLMVRATNAQGITVHPRVVGSNPA